MDDKVHRLTENLQGTTRNLKSLDRMLDQYRDVSRDHKYNVDRLHQDIGRTHQQIREERGRAQQRDYGSDSEYEVSSPARRRRKPRRSTVRFADDMNRELHDLHHTVRDLSSDHLNLETTFRGEVERRDGYDMDTRQKIREISDDLRRFTASDPVADRVERRLRLIQSEMEGDRFTSGRNEELSNLSMELRNALQQNQLHQQQAAMEERIRSSFLQSESKKNRYDSDLEELRRKLDMSEGSKSALQSQVDDLRNQMRRMETDKTKMKSHLEEARLEEELRERRRRKSMEEDQKKNLERELMELKSQLSRGAISEMDEVRRSLEKSERQRVQLSDHIETLTKDLENREKQTAKLINQLKDISDKCEDTERHKNHLLVQVEDTGVKLRDSNRELEKAVTELRNTQLALSDAEKKRDEFKGRAQETVRQWKMKVKQLERELDRFKHGNNQMMQRNEQLIKEMESVRQGGHTISIQLENMRRELGDALAVRAAQDEQIRLKDVEINELKSLRMDLDRELRDTRTVTDRLENELHNAQARVAQVTEDKSRLEDRLSAVEAAHCLSQDQAAQLQQELKDLSGAKAQAATELSEANGKIHDLRQSYLEIQHREKAAREEAKLYQKQMHEERDNSRMAVEALKRDLNETKVREAHVLQDLQRKLKKDKAEYEAAIQALKMELSEDKSSLKISKRNEEKYRKDAEILQQGMNRLEEENHKLLSRIEQTKHEFEAQINECDVSKVKKLEDELFLISSELKKADRKYENLAQDMITEVDALMDIMSTGSIEKFKTISAVKGVPNGSFIADIKMKMKWLRSQTREKIKYEQKVRKDLREALTCSDSDRKFLLQELAKREEVLDELAIAKSELAHREIENIQAVEKLEDHILNLTDELELRKIREAEQHKSHEFEKQQIIEDIEGMRDKERRQIEERYLRLQDTMKALQDEIQVANVKKQKTLEIEKNQENRRRSPGRKKQNGHVRISVTPSKSPRRSHTPPCRLPKDHDESINPMAMSDEEFDKHFAVTHNALEESIM